MIADTIDIAGKADRRPSHEVSVEKMIGQSPGMLQVHEQVHLAAQGDCTVLILGESGTGKELVAEAIHCNSRRKDGPYVVVNIAAIPTTLVESELFGHRRGAFSGAIEPRVGRFEQAHRGTLFIDEIGDFERSSQAKLLRVLESHTIVPVGSNDERKVDIRVVAATSRNLEELIETNDFREDLYYRLNVVTIALPPLREHPEDIPLLVHHFLQKFWRRQHGTAPPKLEPSLLHFLQSYHWPGNVRQLRNCIECMVTMARRPMLTPDDLPAFIHHRPPRQTPPHYEPPDQPTRIEELEREAIERAMEQFHGNRTQAAQSLGISVRTLYRRLNHPN